METRNPVMETRNPDIDRTDIQAMQGIIPDLVLQAQITVNPSITNPIQDTHIADPTTTSLNKFIINLITRVGLTLRLLHHTNIHFLLQKNGDYPSPDRTPWGEYCYRGYI